MTATQWRVTGGLLVLLGALVLTTPLGSAIAELTANDESPTFQPDEDQSQQSGPFYPRLSADDQSQVNALVASDKRLAGILEGRQYEISSVVPWGGLDEEGKSVPVIGAAVTLTLAEETTFPMQEWPLIDFDPAADPPYGQSNLKMSAEKVTEFALNVDLQKQEIVHIEPAGPDVQITPGPDYLAHATPPTGE
jgi:hypothetical protein